MLFVLGIWNSAMSIGLAQNSIPPTDLSAVQAIQQAPDPSATVAAYANGIAADRKDSAIHAAYVARMVDFGLPEMAYRQAQSLTTLEPRNGLGWAVVAHVDARRGNMEEALASINMAGQSAPDNKFVQRTAGEILAWYDTRADQSRVPDETKAGLARLREVVNGRPDYIAAYDTAKKAYQTETQPAQPLPPQPAPTPVAPQSQVEPPLTPPVGYTPPYALSPDAYVQAAPPPLYPYNDYYYDWGPGWVEPSPAWWWRPSGLFVGFDFFPFPSVFVFDHHRHGDFHHGRDGFVRDRPNGQFFNGQRDRRIAQTSAVSSRNSGAFFGSAARPDPRLRSSQTESRFRANTGLLSPGAAVRQGNTISGPSTSSTALAPAVPSSNLRRSSTATFQSSPAAGASTTVRSTPPATVGDPAVRQGILPASRSSATAGATAPATSRSLSGVGGGTSATTMRDPAVRQGILPSSRSSAPATGTSPATSRSLSSVAAGSPVLRQSPATITPRVPAVSRPALSAPVVRTAPSFSPPGFTARSAPSFSVPNAGIRSAPMASRPSFSAPSHMSSGAGVHMGGAGSGAGVAIGGGRGGGRR
ncbi:MAG: hypothetical protein JWM16_4563 [Verrucomicrobiales bacterium]|nr:hypothetical protein [Verrucomicrobiales bacterium]